MAKFSGKTSSQAAESVMTNNFVTREDYTTNFEDGGAFDITDAAQRLYTRVATSLVGENKFYESAQKHDSDILKDIKPIAQDDPLFLLQLAAYARNTLKLRSIPIVLLAETAAAQEPGATLTGLRDYVPKILRRADEPAELIGYWITRFGNIGNVAPGKAIPNALKKGIADALENFDEYQLEKYNRNGNVTLRDVLRIVHPKPTSTERGLMYRYLVYGDSAWNMWSEPHLNDSLPIITAKHKFTKLREFNSDAKQLMKDGHLTWEVAISQFGNKKEIWDELDLPIFATVRNMRNIITSGSRKALGAAVQKLSDPEIVQKSRMLPFRFYTAAREVWGTQDVDPFDQQMATNALNKALELAVANVPDIGGRTAVMVDCSGSMDYPLSKNSTVSYREISALFGAITTACYPTSIVIPFAQRATLSQSNGNILQQTKEVMGSPGNLGYATFIGEAFKVLGTTKVDRIIMFSDMQCYNPGSLYSNQGQDVPTALPLANYRRTVNPACKLYSVDLAGYGTAQVPTDDPQTALIAGWSERIFDLINAFEVDKTSVIDMIRNADRN